MDVHRHLVLPLSLTLLLAACDSAPASRTPDPAAPAADTASPPPVDAAAPTPDVGPADAAWPDPADVAAPAPDVGPADAAWPDPADAAAPDLDPAAYPPAAAPALGGVAPCDFDHDHWRCELAVSGAGLLAIDLVGEVTGFVRRTVVRWDGPLGLTTDAGEALYGYRATSTGALLPTLGPIPFPTLLPPRPTTQVALTLNLDANDEVVPTGFDPAYPSGSSNFATSVGVFDSLGASHELELYFTHIGPGEWSWAALARDAELAGGDPMATTRTAIASGVLEFNDEGVLDIAASTASAVTFGAAASQEIAVSFGAALSDGGDGAGTTQFASASAVADLDQDGYPAGAAERVAVAWDGWLCARYSNGVEACPGRLAVALFEAPAHLSAYAPGVWVPSGASGAPLPGPAYSGGRGGVAGVTLPAAGR